MSGSIKKFGVITPRQKEDAESLCGRRYELISGTGENMLMSLQGLKISPLGSAEHMQRS